MLWLFVSLPGRASAGCDWGVVSLPQGEAQSGGLGGGQLDHVSEGLSVAPVEVREAETDFPFITCERACLLTC